MQSSIVLENFPNDRDYTITALVEDIALLERHIRDGSWKICECIPEKHLPLIAGLASEGVGFAEDEEEKQFMAKLRDQARILKAKIAEGRFTDENAEKLRDWARNLRHSIEESKWSETEDIEFNLHLNSTNSDLTDLEEKHVDEILDQLSEKYEVPKPRYRFVDGCNPLKDAWMKGKNLKIGETSIPMSGEDELIFCRGGASAYSISHEFMHYADRFQKGETNEESATEQALEETGNSKLLYKHKSLYGLNVKYRFRDKMVKRKLSALKGYVPLIAGVVAGEALDETGMIDNAVAPIAGTFTGLAKAVVGGVILAAGALYMKGTVGDILIGASLPIISGGIKTQFFPGGLISPAASLGARNMMMAAPTQLTPYSVPTGVRLGHPTLTPTYIPPRPGILSPTPMTAYGGRMEAGLSGKWMLGSR